MVEESDKMVIDTKTRLDKAIADLKQLIVCHLATLQLTPPDLYYLQASAKEESGLATDEELIKAEKIIEEATL